MKTIQSICATLRAHECLNATALVCIKGGSEEDKRRGHIVNPDNNNKSGNNNGSITTTASADTSQRPKNKP